MVTIWEKVFIGDQTIGRKFQGRIGLAINWKGSKEGAGFRQYWSDDSRWQFRPNFWAGVYLAPSELGIPNVTQRVELSMFMDSEFGEGHYGPTGGSLDITAGEEPPKPPPPPPPPPIVTPPTPPTSLNMLDWIKYLADVIKWSVDSAITSIAKGILGALQYLWMLIPEDIRNNLTSFFRDTLRNMADGFILFGKLATSPTSWIRTWLDEIVRLTGGHVKAESPDVFVATVPGPPGLDTDVPWPWGGLVSAFRAVTGDFSETASRSQVGAQTAFSTFPEKKPGEPGSSPAPMAYSLPEEVPDWKKRSDAVVQKYLDKIAATATGPIDDLFKLASPVTPEVALTVGGSVVAAATLVTLASSISGIAAEIASLGQVEEVGKATRQMIKLTGIQGMAKEFVSTPLKLGVLPWIHRHYDAIFRTHIYSTDQVDDLFLLELEDRKTWRQHYQWYGFPEPMIDKLEQGLRRDPSERILDMMLLEGQIAEKDWKDAYRRKGWKDVWTEPWLKTIWAEPRGMLLVRMLDAAPDEEKQIRAWVRQNGYHGEDLEAMMRIAFRLAYKDEVKGLIESAVTDFVAGWITEDSLEEKLTDLNRPEDEVELKVAIAHERHSREIREIQFKTLKVRASRGAITIEEYGVGLSQLGMQPDRVQVEKGSILLEQEEAGVRSLTITEVRRLFRDNISPESETEEMLLARNVPLQDAKLMIQDDWITIFRDERTKLISAALEDLDYGVADANTTRLRLISLRLRPEESELRIATTQAAHKRRTQREYEKIYTEDFQNDVLNEENFRGALRALGLLTWRVDEIVSLEKRRKVPMEQLEK